LQVDRHLPFLHRFQQGALRARRGPVDLVGQQDLAQHGAGAIFELLRLLVEEADAGHVAGQQVRRELDAAEGRPQRNRHRLGQGGLAGAGHILQQDMPLAQDGRENQVDDVLFAHDDALHVLTYAPGSVRNHDAHPIERDRCYRLSNGTSITRLPAPPQKPIVWQPVAQGGLVTP